MLLVYVIKPGNPKIDEILGGCSSHTEAYTLRNNYIWKLISAEEGINKADEAKLWLINITKEDLLTNHFNPSPSKDGYNLMYNNSIVSVYKLRTIIKEGYLWNFQEKVNEHLFDIIIYDSSKLDETESNNNLNIINENNSFIKTSNPLFSLKDKHTFIIELKGNARFQQLREING